MLYIWNVLKWVLQNYLCQTCVNLEYKYKNLQNEGDLYFQQPFEELQGQTGIVPLQLGNINEKI